MIRDTCHWCDTGALTAQDDDRCVWCILAGIGPPPPPAPTLAEQLRPWLWGALLAALMCAPSVWMILTAPQPAADICEGLPPVLGNDC
jgi:hypothetical protein